MRFVLLLTVVVAGLLAIGWVPTRNLGGPEAVSGMLLGLWLEPAGCHRRWPAAGRVRRLGHREDQGIAALLSLAIRMGLTLMGALVAVLTGLVAPQGVLCSG